MPAPGVRVPKRCGPPSAFLKRSDGPVTKQNTKAVDTGRSASGEPLDPLRYSHNCYVASITEGTEQDVWASQKYGVWATTKYRTNVIVKLWDDYITGKSKTPPLLIFTAYREKENRPVYGAALMQGLPDQSTYTKYEVCPSDPDPNEDEEEEETYGPPWAEPDKYGDGFPVYWLLKYPESQEPMRANYRVSQLRDLEQISRLDAVGIINDLKDRCAFGTAYLKDDAGLLIFERISELRLREEEATREVGKKPRRQVEIGYDIAPPADDPELPGLYPPVDAFALFATPVPPRDYWDPTQTSFSAYIYDIDYYDAPTISDSPDGEGPLDEYNFLLAPVLRLFGVTNEGYSVCAYIHGFTPYFYVRAPESFVERLEYDRKTLTPDVLDVDHRDPKPGTHIYAIAHHPTTMALCSAFRGSLSTAIMEGMKYPDKKKYGYPHSVRDETGQWHRVSSGSVEPPCHKVELVRKETIKGWRPHLEWFLRVSMATPHFFKSARTVLETGSFVWLRDSKGRPSHGVTAQAYEIFEANIVYVLRYMIDANLAGCGWMTFPKEKYSRFIDPASHRSRADIEVLSRWKTPIPHAPDDPAWGHHAPVRYVAFDIECAGRDSRFPIPDCDDGDPIICISIKVAREHEDPTKRHIGDILFTWGSCASIKETNVLCYYRRRAPHSMAAIRRDLAEGSAERRRCGWSRMPDGSFAYWTPDDERTMLKQVFEFITKVARPQFLTGYNIDDFDVPYLLKRATHLGIKEFSSLGWIKDSHAKIKTKIFESKARGRRELCDIQLPGLVPLDVFKDVMLRHKLRSYTLNAVASHFLTTKTGEPTDVKADVPHHLIGPMWRDTDESRKLVAYYCWKVRRS